MKSIYSFLFFFLFSNFIFSQSIVDSLDWAKAINNQGLGSLRIETDDEDNIYVAGVYDDCQDCFISIESDTIYQDGNGYKKIFLAKLNKNGELEESLLYGDNEDVFLSSFKIDNNNRIILYILSTNQFSNPGSPIVNYFKLLKFDQNLDIVWDLDVNGSTHSFNPSGPFGRLEEQISINETNDIILGGSINYQFDLDVIVDSIIIFGDTLPIYLLYYDTLEIGNEFFTVNDHNIFITKISEQGNLEWVKTFENDNYIELTSIDASQDQEINILGLMSSGDWVIGADTLKIDTSRSYYSQNAFVLKTDSQGDPIWANKYFEGMADACNIISDNNGNLIVSGLFGASTYFNQDTIYSNGSTSDILLFKINETGNLLWAQAVGDSYSSGHSDVIINNKDEIYLSGEISKNLGVIMNKFSPSGDLIWELNPTQSENRLGGDLAFDYSGNLIQTGIYNIDFVIGDYTLEDNNNSWSQFLLKFRNQTTNYSTSLNEILQNYNNVVLSPNPSSSETKLQTNGLSILNLKLFNMNGQLIWQNQEPFFNSKSINFSFLTNGSYILKLQTSEGTISKKMIITK